VNVAKAKSEGDKRKQNETRGLIAVANKHKLKLKP
jgi:hypothetical protein